MKFSKAPRPQLRLRRPPQFNTGFRYIQSIVPLGATSQPWRDTYHRLLRLTWTQFLGLICLLYLFSNTLFALLYLAGGDCIQNARPGSFWDVFFFSVQTMATIGYGALYPKTVYANAIVAIEALVGLLGVATITGLTFARISLPTARVLFSQVATIVIHDGVPTLMFRAANKRRSQIVEAQMRVTLVRNEVTAEGKFMRRLLDLPLMRSQTPIFALTWTVMHPIDPSSPLYGYTPEMLIEKEVELVVTLTGIDETVSQTVHARHSFLVEEILWNVNFVDIFSVDQQGQRYIDYTKFHDVEPVGED